MSSCGDFRQVALIVVFAFTLCVDPLPVLAAADKSGIAAQKISLPKGPGSIEGLGESFEPQLNSGTAGYTVNFKLPPGRAGHAPAFGVHYEGGSGDGLLGMGWSLTGIGYVQRQTDKGLPTYDSHHDVFITSDGEELVPLSDGTYRAENEGAFRRYHFDTATNTWRCDLPDGTKVVFAAATASRIEQSGACAGTCSNTGAACKVDADCTRTFRWYVTSRTDPNGNVIRFYYRPFDTLPQPFGTPERMVYLDRAEYTLHATETLPGRHVVLFTYETRPDPIADYRPGFELVTARRLRRVDVCTVGVSAEAAAAFSGTQTVCPAERAGTGATRVRAYEFAYEDDDRIGACGGANGLTCTRGLLGALCLSAHDCFSGVSRLAEVVELGADNVRYSDRAAADRPTALPPARFRYTDIHLPSFAGDVVPPWRTAAPFPGDVLSDPDGTLIDLNSDGLADAVRLPGHDPHWWENLGPAADGEVRFADRGATSAPPFALGAAGVQLADFDGNGNSDLVAPVDSAQGTFQIYPGTGQGRFGLLPAAFNIVNYAGFLGPQGFENPEVRLVDLDFDKRSDVLRTVPGAFPGTSDRFEVLLNTGTQLVRQPPCASIPNAYFPGGNTFLTEMNGDRLLDLVVMDTSYDPARILVYPSTGRGAFGRDGRCDQPGPGFLMEGTPKPIELGSDPSAVHWQDVTNDGLSDLVVVLPSLVRVWVNVGGTRLLRLADIPLPANFDFGKIEFADLNGNGTTDLILVGKSDPSSARFLDFTAPGNVPPHLLAEITNGIGRVTRIDYRSSALDSARDRDAKRPWRTRVPFPVNVVAKRTISFGLDLDGVPGEDQYVSEYRYHDGYYDGREKEFRGFGEVEAIERGDDSEPTLVTRYRFHTGAPDGVDNNGDGRIDEFTANGGAEEESLKGKPLEVRRETCSDGNDGECSAVGEVFDHVFSRWEVRTLYQPKVCSGDRSIGCCADADCAGHGTCVYEDPAHPARRPENTCVAGKPIHFAVSTTKRTAVIEKGVAPRRDLLVETDYDDYGNQTVERNWGVVAATDLPPFGCSLIPGECSLEPGKPCGVDADCIAGTCVRRSLTDGNALCSGDPFAFTNPVEPDDEKFTTTQFAENATDWLVKEECESRTTDENGTVEAQARQSYDGLAPCAPLVKGNLTLSEEWLKNDTEERWLPRVRNDYDAFGNVVQIRDARNDRRDLAYDGAFRTYPVRETVYLGGRTIPLPAQGGVRGETTVPAYTLSVTAAYHEGFGTVIGSTSWGKDAVDGPATQYRYEPFGRLTAIVAPGDSVAAPTSAFEYRLADADAAPGSLAAAINSIVSHKRESAGGGTVDTYQYVDGLGRKLGDKEEGDQASQWVYSGGVGFGRRGAEAASWLPYCTASAGYEAPDPAGARITEVYDATGRNSRTINPDATYSEVRYAPLVTDSYDEDDTGQSPVTPGAYMTHENDGLGRLVHVVERNLQRCGAHCGEYHTRYAYDARGNLTRITDAQSNVKTIRYDSLSRKTFMDDPDRGHMTWVYDDTDDVMSTTDAKGQVNQYAYDSAKRLLTEDYLDPSNITPDVAYVYDIPVTNVDMGDHSSEPETFTAGYLASVYDLSGEEHTAYDDRRRVKWEVKRIADPVTGALGTYATRFGYDSMDRLRSLIYPDGDRLAYEYGSRGLLKQLHGPGAGGKTIVSAVNYRPSGQLAEVIYGNGVLTDYAYDPRLRLSDLHTAGAGATAGQDLIHYGYDFDPVSNITAIRDLHSGIAANDPRLNTQHFQYDDLHRLTRYQLDGPARPDSTGTTISYLYDKIGNMVSQASDIVHADDRTGLSVTDLGTMSYGGTLASTARNGRTARQAPGPHALTTTSGGRNYPYDDNGNMTDIDGMAASWDFKDRLVQLQRSDMTADYAYDYTDRRVSKKVTERTKPTVGTVYSSRYFEVRDNSQPTKYVFMGDTRVARIEGTLDGTALRIQRFRLVAGWNLLSIGVSASNATAQLGVGSDPTILEAYRWNPEKQQFETLGMGDALRPSTVFWIRAAQDVELVVIGGYTPPGSLPVPGPGFYAPPGLEGVSFDRALPSGNVWQYDPALLDWRARAIRGFAFLPPLPTFFSPSTAIFANLSAPAVIDTPPSAARTLYYHQDHLGSSSVLTDDAGTMIEETVFYPYGQSRGEFRSDPHGLAPAKYLYTQKERDLESGLLYFEARYYDSLLGRFVSVDPKLSGGSAYEYGRNAPLQLVDPRGMDSEKPPTSKEAAEDSGKQLSQEADAILNGIGQEFYKNLNHELQPMNGTYSSSGEFLDKLQKEAPGILNRAIDATVKATETRTVESLKKITMDNKLVQYYRQQVMNQIAKLKNEVVKTWQEANLLKKAGLIGGAALTASALGYAAIAIHRAVPSLGLLSNRSVNGSCGGGKCSANIQFDRGGTLTHLGLSYNYRGKDYAEVQPLHGGGQTFKLGSAADAQFTRDRTDWAASGSVQIPFNLK